MGGLGAAIRLGEEGRAGPAAAVLGQPELGRPQPGREEPVKGQESLLPPEWGIQLSPSWCRSPGWQFESQRSEGKASSRVDC